MNFKTLKRISLALAILICLSSILASCGAKPIKSTEEEAAVIGNIGKYEVKYEELRFLTLTCKAELAAKYGDDVFLPESSEYIGDYKKELEEMVSEQICQNYAAAKTFKNNKINVNDSKSKQYAQEYASSVMAQFDSEEEYLAYLEECYMTDAVLRFNASLEGCFYRYYEKLANDIDEEAYNAVMSGDGFIRTMSIFIKNDEGESVEKNRKDAENVLAEIKAGKPLSSFIGSKYNQDTGMCDYYFLKGYFDEEYEEAAFALAVGEISSVVETEEGFYIIQRMETDEGYMQNNIQALKSVYVECKMYENINKLADELVFELNDYGKTLDLWFME